MNLFSGGEIGDFIRQKGEDLEQDVLRISDREIISADLEEWADYMESKHRIDPITVYEDHVEQSLAETKIKTYNVFSRHNSYEPEYYLRDGYRITFTIPFDGDARLLQLRPNPYMLTNFPVESLCKPKGEHVGSIVLCVEIPKGEMESHLDDMTSYVSGMFKSKFKDYRQMISNANANIEGYNKGLRENAMKLLTKRKQKASDFATVSAAMKIPMKVSPDAPTTTPVPLKRVARTPVKKPEYIPPKPEYTISDQDYANILNIIHSTCASMEATARTFAKNDEEELRDFIIATLGTHYENAVTGETFRKIGKTDIRVIFENKAAFIGECKIWHGIKKFSEAVDQLFGYSTWRDSKLALIVFNKENKDFSSIRKTVEQWIKENTKNHKERNGNMWECTVYRDDTKADVSVAVALYDITV